MDSTKSKVSTDLYQLLYVFIRQIKKCSVIDLLRHAIFCVQDEEDYDVMQDPEFLQSVLENLPGVDPNNEAIRNAMGSLASQTGSKPESKKDEEKKK